MVWDWEGLKFNNGKNINLNESLFILLFIFIDNDIFFILGIFVLVRGLKFKEVKKKKFKWDKFFK